MGEWERAKPDKTNIVCSLSNGTDSFRQKCPHRFYFTALQRKQVKGVGGDHSRGKRRGCISKKTAEEKEQSGEKVENKVDGGGRQEKEEDQSHWRKG